MGLLDYFIEKTEDDKSSNIAKAPQRSVPSVPPLPTSVSQAPTQVVSSFPTYSPGISQEDMEKFNAHFEDLFNQANLPGPDYFEFSKMCQAMAALPEDTKFAAAFGGLSVQGLTKAKLLESANHYIAIIDEDAKKFNNAIDGKLIAEVQAKRTDVENRKAKMQEKMNLIAQLQVELSTDSANIERITNEANEQERKASEKLLTYKTACEQRKAAIASDVQKISTYIK